MEKQILIMFGLFFGVQLINVILNTLKTLVMAKFNNRHISALANATAFGFYVAVVKMIATMPLYVTIVVTVVTNIIGVYLSYLIVNKLRRDDLWKIEIFHRDNQELVKKLMSTELSIYKHSDDLITAYSYTQKESHQIKEILKDFPKAKTNIIKVEQKL